LASILLVGIDSAGWRRFCWLASILLVGVVAVDAVFARRCETLFVVVSPTSLHRVAPE
jgi:hypothetical protein